jgi:hypothetical protein
MKEDTVATYDLDVAFSSHVTPNDPNLPVAMAYGFTDNTGGTFVGRGQRHENVLAAGTVNFYVYDTAHDPTYNVTSVQISVVNKTQGPNAAKSPFSDAVWNNVSSVTAVSQPNSSQAQLQPPTLQGSSTGCNVKGKSWGVGPFTVANLQGQQRFEITITVITQDGQSQKSFIVDPEVVVDSGNR